MSIKRYRNSALLKFNIEFYLNREFINNGLYLNVGSGHFDYQGNRLDLLNKINETTYESFIDRWIYETDASGSPGFEPIVASGIYVDNVFFLSGDFPYEPKIDYNHGRVLFNGAPIPSGSEIRAHYGYKQVIVDFPDSNVVNLLFSQAKDNAEFNTYAYPSGNQRQIPLVVIDLQDNFSNPWQLGGGKTINQRVVFHVVANNDNDLEQITDILTNQFRKVIQGVDFNITPQMFTIEGDRASTYRNYTELQSSGVFSWSKIYIDEARLIEKDEFFDYKRARVDWRVRFYRPPGSLD